METVPAQAQASESVQVRASETVRGSAKDWALASAPVSETVQASAQA